MTPEALVIQELLMIADKEGTDMPFELNYAQRQVDANVGPRNVIPKARQEGVSSYILARGLVRCLGWRNTRAVVISHETEATQRMLAKVHYMIDNFRGPQKPVTGSHSKNEITFPHTNSRFYIGTAGAQKFGRGDTITFLHCSEIAYWDNPQGLVRGLFQAVPRNNSEIFVESTGNGQGNYYHRLCMNAAKGDTRFRLTFLPWHTFPEYYIELSDEEKSSVMDSLDSNLEEDYLVDKFQLSAERIAWRREKLAEEFDYDLAGFKQEYPMTLDECFQATGRSIFIKVNYQPHKAWQKLDTNFHGLPKHPFKGHRYAIGADVSAGIGADRSVAEVYDLENCEQVGEYISDRISPDAFGEKLAVIAHHYNTAFINVENNNHGIMTISTLMDNYPTGLIYRQAAGKGGPKQVVDKITAYGWRTSVKSKPYAIGELRRALASWLKIHSPVLKDELNTFVETETGTLEAEEGCFDDCVIAAAMGAVIWDIAEVYTSREAFIPSDGSEPFSLDSIIDELRGRHTGRFMSEQVKL